MYNDVHAQYIQCYNNNNIVHACVSVVIFTADIYMNRSSFNLPQDNNGLLSSMLNSRSNRDDNEQNNQHGRISGLIENA